MQDAGILHILNLCIHIKILNINIWTILDLLYNIKKQAMKKLDYVDSWVAIIAICEIVVCIVVCATMLILKYI